MKTLALVAAAALVTLGVNTLAQEGQRVPGPGSGIIKVEVVGVRGTPIVRSAQEGEWKVVIGQPADVRVANTPTVVVAAPGFVRQGGKYVVTWPSGDVQTIQVLQVGSGGWMRVEAGRPSAQSWINLTAARALDEVP